jgi:hypothetical protein
MVAAGVAADERGGREPPKAVRLKPFFGKRRLEVRTSVLIEGDHSCRVYNKFLFDTQNERVVKGETTRSNYSTVTVRLG